MVKVLIVCSGTKGELNKFVKEQMDSLEKLGISIVLFQIYNEGILGYLFHRNSLKRLIREEKPDIVHAHYGLSGLLANLQRLVPVVTTFHGSDINNHYILYLSRLTHRLSSASIFVSEDLKRKVPDRGTSYIIPCGVDMQIFRQLPPNEKVLPKIVDNESINILFSSRFTNQVKNAELAKKGCDLLEKIVHRKINLIELDGYSRNEVLQLINAVECILLTSFSEGSPQIIKEAMACNCPVVATDVGDISYLIGDTEGCFLCNFDPADVTRKLKSAIDHSERIGATQGRQRVIKLKLDSENIAKRIVKVYCRVLKQ